MTTTGERLTVFLTFLVFVALMISAWAIVVCRHSEIVRQHVPGWSSNILYIFFVTGTHIFRSDKAILAILADAGIHPPSEAEFVFFRKQQRRMNVELMFVQLALFACLVLFLMKFVFP